MIFMLAQALDNTSEDPFAFDGESAMAPSLAEEIERFSQIRRHGSSSSHGHTRFWRYEGDIALEIKSQESDVLGRAAPLTAVLREDELEDVVAVVEGLERCARQIGRSFDPAPLESDLSEWRKKKTRG